MSFIVSVKISRISKYKGILFLRAIKAPKNAVINLDEVANTRSYFSVNATLTLRIENQRNNQLLLINETSIDNVEI